MLQVGQLKIRGDGKWPRSRVIMKKELREFARTLGLELDFVVRKKKTSSGCQISTAHAIVCEGVVGKLFPMPEVVEYTLHEIAHWIQYNEGMFRNYFGTPYYDGWLPPSLKDQLRLAMRAERHADWLGRKLAMEMFGVYLVGRSFYDKDNDEVAKAFLKKYYEAHAERP